MKIIKLGLGVTSSNDRDADALRDIMRSKGSLLINLMSSPGSGKTTLLSGVINDMRDLRIAVLEADIESDVDAVKIESLGAKAVQVHTGGMCHMDAGMTTEAVRAIDEECDIMFLENVGNLICPAEYDTGAGLNVMILSVTEGDDKPLKYPLMFEKSDALVISKTDALEYFDFDIDKCTERVRKLNGNIRIFPLSAKTGDGMKPFENWLREKLDEWKTK